MYLEQRRLDMKPNSTYEKRIDWKTSTPLEQRLDHWHQNSSPQSKMVVGEPLSRRCSLRIGGEAAYWIEAGTRKDLEALLEALGETDACYVGLGSDVLFPDEGIDVPVIKLVGELAEWDVEEDGSQTARVDVAAGAVNAHLVRGLLKDGWVGAEFLTLIPGTFGGAVALNAGTKEQELCSILETAVVAIVDHKNACWRIERRSSEELEMRYRHTALPEGALVVGGTIRVQRGDVAAARERVAADKQRRNQTQPYRLASVGSTFANPEGDYAGRLIDEAGLKGASIGGARISELHANFFINEEDATAEDFLRLMALARYRVRRDFGVQLRPEVRFVGFDGMQRLAEYERQLENADD